MPALRIAAILSAAVTISGYYLRPPRLRLVYIFKPLTTLLILACALLPAGLHSLVYQRAIVLGLCFSLVGDILLMLPRDLFGYGLAAFLLAHLCYITAFRSGALVHGFVMALGALVVIAVLVVRFLWSGIPTRLRGPVVAYIGIIVLMVALSIGQALLAPTPQPREAASGALLFMASDALLAVDRFGRPFRLARALVLGTYFAAQLLIASSI